MKCRDFERYVGAYLAGTLPEAIRRLMDDHLASCSACGETFLIQERIGHALTETAPIDAPHNLFDSILGLITEETGETGPVSVIVTAAPPVIVDCGAFERQVAAFTEGSIENGLFAAMTAHRDACPSCNRLAHVHETVLTSLMAAEPVSTPEGLTLKILAAVEREETVHIFAWSWQKRVVTAAAVAACAAMTGVASYAVGILFDRAPKLDVLATPLKTKVFAFLSNTIGAALSPYVTKMLAVSDKLVDTYLSPLHTFAGSAAVFMTKPLTIPYTSEAVPPYYVAALMLIGFVSWVYFRETPYLSSSKL